MSLDALNFLETIDQPKWQVRNFKMSSICHSCYDIVYTIDTSYLIVKNQIL